MMGIKLIDLGMFVGLLCHSVICENIVNEVRSEGKEAPEIKWPFVAALFKVEGSQFFCGGTVISNKHILSAAHCVQTKSSSIKLLPIDVVVRLGTNRLTPRSNSSKTRERSVSDIHVHPDWNVYSEIYDANIAIFVLKYRVHFSNYIQPVCLPIDNAVTEGGTGYAVGWSFVANGTWQKGEFLQQAITNSLNSLYCFTTDYISAQISSPRTFCGSGLGSPYRGDSGGGFFIKSESCWVQYGILSALRSNNTGYIDTNAFAIYTNVVLFKNWIEETMNKSEDVVTAGEIAGETNGVTANETTPIGIFLSCELSNVTCFINDINIQRKNILVVDMHNKRNRDIQKIIFQNSWMNYLPDGIGNWIRNLNYLGVRDTRLKLIRRSNFANMKNLKEIHIHPNNIKAFNEDVLWDLPNLEQFTLRRNALKVLNERAFEKNPKLRSVNLCSNKLKSLHRNLFQNNPLLEKVNFSENNLKVIEIDFTALRHIKIIEFGQNVCIDAMYHNVTVNVAAKYRSLICFQCLIDNNCNSVNP